MHIGRISIKNFRNFGDPEFRMKLKPFTLILGENNIGKSNLLNAIGLIFSQDLSVFRRRVLEIDDINYASIRSFKEKVGTKTVEAEEIEFPEVRIEVTLKKMNDDQKAVVADWFIDEELEKAKITYLFGLKGTFDKAAWIKRERERFLTKSNGGGKVDYSAIDFPIEEYRYSVFGGDDSANECQQYLLRMLKMEYLDALRDAEQELVASGSARLLYRVLAQSEASGYEDIRAALGDFESVVKENRNLKDVKEEIEKLLGRVSLAGPGNDNSIDFRVSAPETTELLKKISLIYGADPIDVARNGLGRNNLLYIALVLSHLAAKDKRGSDTYFRCIGIEEPEAHLHPQLQDHLAENIESIAEDEASNTQLLLTSHSTHIAARLKLRNTVILYKDRSTGRIRGHYVLRGLDKIKDKKSVRYLTKFLDATQSRLFFARKIILVEGISEKLLVPVFFRLYCGQSLEASGYEVISVQGVAFRHFLKIIKGGYFIKCLVLTDKDTGKKTENRAAALKESFRKVSLIKVEASETSTFEKDLIEANKKGEGKKVLLGALKATRLTKGEAFARRCEGKAINTDEFFDEIEGYKSEFALNLKQRLEADGKSFVLPAYITGGFDFLRDGNGEE